MKLTYAALVMFVVFVSTAAMTTSWNETGLTHCRLMAQGAGGEPGLYKCEGACPAEGPQSGKTCELRIVEDTIRCYCGDFVPFSGCTGEYDMGENGVGYFCYTLQGCDDPLECDFNATGQTQGWWTVCICRS